MKRMHAGDLIVDRDGQVGGMIGGDVIIRGGANVVLDAMVGGDVIVEDGHARVRGMVAGRVIGSADIDAMVGG
ncbi:hypothetical protein SAMN05192583_0834 [Sphingomonas gellani]|uniref:Polymer-forming cytoskeletal protein n=1 Tax=Sphingomonas gellani TaxID=1166340 RepID=A0A1H7ZS65_9SPHN|nr:hypothetical protein [Sphingomonas gellani]SEM61482.1 hypothetical protein SAMN05192583_0834 [Sphingomonas gellani]